MNISQDSFKEYLFIKHKEVLKLLDSVFTDFGLTYFLIGANARDVHLFKIGEVPSRGTADIDFAIMLSNKDNYNDLINALIEEGFNETSIPHRLYYESTNTVIDLLPYGQIEQHFTENFTERMVELSVLGFKEVGEVVENIELSDDLSLPVPPIEGIIILKIVSWHARPESRAKDLGDISDLLKHAWSIYQDEAYEHHLDLFDDENFQTIKASARIIGRRMSKVLKQSDSLRATITSVLSRAVTPKPKAENPELKLAIELDKSVEETQLLLKEMLLGIHD